MRWQAIGESYCSIARSLSVVGDRWTLLILREAFSDVHRFDDFRQHLGVARNVLAARLARLVDEGVLTRIAYQVSPRRHEYRLTEKGRDLYPVLLALLRWGDRWMAGDDGAPLVLIHENCDHEADPALTCAHCGETLEPEAVRAKLRAPLVAHTSRGGAGGAGAGVSGPR